MKITRKQSRIGGGHDDRSGGDRSKSPRVKGGDQSYQVRRPDLSLAPGSARSAKAQSEVRKRRCWGRREQPPNSRDEAKPDGPGLGPHPYPTWGLLPVFVAYPLDDGPVAWRCKRAGGWGLAANVSRVRAGVADPLLQPGPTSQLGQSRVQGFQYFFDPSILVRLL